MKNRLLMCFAIVIVLCVGIYFGLKVTKEDISLAEARNIAELATYEAYYHNVVILKEDEMKSFINIIEFGYKEMWYEYNALVKFGIDVDKLEISKPNDDGVVKVKVPESRVLEKPEVIAQSLTKPIVETGLFTKITSEDNKNALIKAQKKLIERAENDEYLLKMTQDRAKVLLEQYIINVGDALGKEYTVKWVE